MRRIFSAFFLITVLAFCPLTRAASQPIVDRIEVFGVSEGVFNSGEVEALLEVAPGEPIEKSKVIRSEGNIRNLYARRGFPEVVIQSRISRKPLSGLGSGAKASGEFETVLEFKIKEGVARRVAKVTLHGETLDVARTQQLSKLLQYKEGEVFNQDKLNEKKRAVEEALVADQFVGTRIEESVATVKASEISEALRSLYPESKWVSVSFQADLGEQVEFRFQGNSVFTFGYLSSLVNEQRLLGLGKNYIPVIQKKIEEEYRDHGFSHVRIAALPFEASSNSGTKTARVVTFRITEGPRVLIDSVDFDGVSSFTKDKLTALFFENAPSGIQNRIYSEKGATKAAEILVEKLRENGFLGARLVTLNSTNLLPNLKEQSHLVRLTVYLYEGDQTLVRSIDLRGIQQFTYAEVLETLRVGASQPLNLFALGSGVSALRKKYRDIGYLAARIDSSSEEGAATSSPPNSPSHSLGSGGSLIKYSDENRIADISVQVFEGPKFRVGHIEIVGAALTDEDVILREITFRVGDVLKESEIEASERNLRRLGVFSSVEIRPTDGVSDRTSKVQGAQGALVAGVPQGSSGEEAKTVKIAVHEADRGILSYGPGFRSDLGLRVFGQLSYSNLLGRNHTVSVSAAVNRRLVDYHFIEAQGVVAYSWPWFLFPAMSFRPSATVGRTQYINFFAENVSAMLQWEKAVLPSLQVTFSYAVEKIFQHEAQDARDNGQFRIGSITPRVVLDLRDSPYAPTSGYYGTTWADLSYPLLGSQQAPDPAIGYYRIQTRHDYYVSLYRDFVLFASFRCGFESAFQGDSFSNQAPYVIPLIKQFALGGIGSIRGYKEQELNNPFVLNGESMSYVNYRTQLDVPLSGAFKFGIFGDAGNILVNNFSFGGLKYGAGFGIHYNSPVGPVNLDWGFKVDPPPGSDTQLIHFSVGVM